MKRKTKSKSYSAYKLVVYFKDKPSGESRVFYAVKDPAKCLVRLEQLVKGLFRGKFVTALIYENSEVGTLHSKWVGDTQVV